MEIGIVTREIDLQKLNLKTVDDSRYNDFNRKRRIFNNDDNNKYIKKFHKKCNLRNHRSLKKIQFLMECLKLI